MILFCAGDLLWATRIKRTGDALGVACRPVRTPQMLADRLGEGGASLLIIDLDAPDPFPILVDARALAPDLHVLCFAPHVREDLIARARSLGAHQVLSRGAFDRGLGEILSKWSARGHDGVDALPSSRPDPG